MPNYINRIPKKYRAAVSDFYHDEDGWWINLDSSSGYRFSGYYSDYTIHEETFADAICEFRSSIVAE